MPSISLPLLEIKLHFAAVAVPDEFDQDRGTDSSPFLESLGTALAQVSCRRQGQHHVVSGWNGKKEQGVYFCFHPRSAEAFLDPDSVDFIFC